MFSYSEVNIMADPACHVGGLWLMVARLSYARYEILPA
jgi:hypothetical protein